MPLHCVKCKQKTADKGGLKEAKTKNNKSMVSSTCEACGSKKTSFVKKAPAAEVSKAQASK
jgi:hypothetical protein